jgi:hypothetical protein
MSQKKDKQAKKNWYGMFKKAKGFDRNDPTLPPIVQQPIEFLLQNGLKEEGIFRVPGVQDHIKELKKRYDKGKKIDLTGEDIHNVAGLLKLFFRELPEPLLTFELYESFIAAMAQPEQESQIECIGRAIEVLPAGNKSILKYLVQFLSRVAAVKENSMTSTNIAIVFAPNLIRPRVETYTVVITNSPSVNRLLALMIDNHERLFANVRSPRGEPAEEGSTKIAVSARGARPPSSSVGSPGGELSPRRTRSDNGLKFSPGDNSPKVADPKGQKAKDKQDKAAKKEKKTRIKKKGKSPSTGDAMQLVKSEDPKETFINTLKMGTRKLAAALLEEQELVVQMAELNVMSPKEREGIEQQIITKLEATVKLRQGAKRKGVTEDTFVNPNSPGHSIPTPTVSTYDGGSPLAGSPSNTEVLDDDFFDLSNSEEMEPIPVYSAIPLEESITDPEKVVQSVAEGDLTNLNSYIESMKKMKRMDRQNSSRAILTGIQRLRLNSAPSNTNVDDVDSVSEESSGDDD